MVTRFGFVWIVLAALLPLTARGDGPAERKAIHDDYKAKLGQAERERIARLTELAARQREPESDATYRELFLFAVTTDHYREAEPAAERLLATGTADHAVDTLAHLVNLIAEADKGEFDKSMVSLKAFLAADRSRNPPPPEFRTGTLLTVGEAYYHRLVRGNRFDLAKTLCELVIAQAENPVIRGHFEARLRKLALLGQPAPPIEGPDADGTIVKLADSRGKVVLVGFWATWCAPCVEEIPFVTALLDEFGSKGLVVIAVDVDATGEPGKTVESITPLVRRFLLENRVRWPSLFSDPAGRDLTKAYAVVEIPSNVLIGRDGKIVRFDLRGAELRDAIRQELARP
jgi:thiol-disulfide isomerase/thioredoxin